MLRCSPRQCLVQSRPQTPMRTPCMLILQQCSEIVQWHRRCNLSAQCCLETVPQCTRCSSIARLQTDFDPLNSSHTILWSHPAAQVCTYPLRKVDTRRFPRHSTTAHIALLRLETDNRRCSLCSARWNIPQRGTLCTWWPRCSPRQCLYRSQPQTPQHMCCNRYSMHSSRSPKHTLCMLTLRCSPQKYPHQSRPQTPHHTRCTLRSIYSSRIQRRTPCTWWLR